MFFPLGEEERVLRGTGIITNRRDRQGLWGMVRVYDFQELEEIGHICYLHFICKDRMSPDISQFLDRNLEEEEEEEKKAMNPREL